MASKQDEDVEREANRNDELDESPVPDPTTKSPDADDDSEAD